MKNGLLNIIQKTISIILIVVVLIICAKMFFGENGVLQRATEERATRDEDNIYMKIYRNGYLDESGEIVPIPKGFYYVGGTISTGVVISDNENDKNKYKQQESIGSDLEGNQWVWVPVNTTIGNNNLYTSMEIDDYISLIGSETNEVTTFKYSKFYNFYDVNKKALLLNYYLENKSENINDLMKPGGTLNREPDILNYEIYEGKDNFKKVYAKGINKTFKELEFGVKELAQQYVDDYIEMTKSIELFNGFYVGRYELTGKKGNCKEISGEVLTGYNSDGTSLDWYDFYNECQSFYVDNSYVMSTMIWGIQWDAIMIWIDSTAENTGKYIDSNNRSIDWGNYGNKTSIKIKTGFNQLTVANNIYDLAGNCSEWTQEAYGNNRILRGSNYIETNQNNFYASYREESCISYISDKFSSRPVLYLKNRNY